MLHLHSSDGHKHDHKCMLECVKRQLCHIKLKVIMCYNPFTLEQKTPFTPSIIWSLSSWEKEQSAFIPRSNDSAVVMDIYLLQLQLAAKL